MAGESEVVVVVDDDQAVRESLGMLLEAAGYRAALFGSAQDFLNGGLESGPGCLILDLRMPGVDGLELQRRLHEDSIHLPVIFLSAHGDVGSAVGAMREGALTFLQKPVDEELLLAHVREALEVGRSADSFRNELRQFRAGLEELTPREREVLERVAGGHPNKRIAGDLGISERTVEVHRARLIQKLQVGSSAELVRLYTLHCNDTGPWR